jgi:hypothetical protein
MSPLNESQIIREQVVTEIAGDKRSKQRYPIDLAVKYNIVKNGLVIGTATGNTVDVSSDGIAFTTIETLRVGAYLELNINWPVLLNGSCAMKLVVEGKVVRSDGSLTAIRILRYEFRTRGRLGSQSQPASARDDG